MSKSPAKEYEELRAAIVEAGEYLQIHVDEICPDITTELGSANTFSLYIEFDRSWDFHPYITTKRTFVASERERIKALEKQNQEGK